MSTPAPAPGLSSQLLHDPDLDVTLEHRGAVWTVACFGDDTFLVSEVGDGNRCLNLDKDRLANAKVVTFADAIDTVIEEAHPVIDLFGLCVLLQHGAILLAPRASVGPYLFANREEGFACLLGPTGVVEEGYVRIDTLVERYGMLDSEEGYAPDRSAFGAARVFLDRATARGVRIAVARFEEKRGLATTRQAAACTP